MAGSQHCAVFDFYVYKDFCSYTWVNLGEQNIICFATTGSNSTMTCLWHVCVSLHIPDLTQCGEFTPKITSMQPCRYDAFNPNRKIKQ